jgi:hypothetical protein
MLHQAGQFRNQLIQPAYFLAKTNLRRFCFLLIMSELIARFKRQENQSQNLNWKKNIGEGMKMFRKYQLTVWLSIQHFYSHFTKVTRKCECFGRIVEPC